jgi:hypothetical protein
VSRREHFETAFGSRRDECLAKKTKRAAPEIAKTSHMPKIETSSAVFAKPMQRDAIELRNVA